MPTIEILIANDKVSIDSGELAKALKQPAAGISLVSEALSLIRDKPISALSGDFLQVGVTLGHEFQWDIPFSGAAGMLTVTVDPSVDAKLILRKAGELLQFQSELHPDGEDLPLEPPPPAMVPPGMAYISLLLRVSLAASGTAAVQPGPFGIKGTLGTDQRFLLAYHHAVNSDMLVADAVKEALTSFVLPYAPDRILALGNFCFSEFECIGEIEFGVEATAGYSGTLLQATSKRELALAKDTEIGKFAFKLKPEYQLGAAVRIGYTHLDAFRVVARGLDSQRVGLFYFKMDQRTFSAGFTLGAQVKLNPGLDIELAHKLTDRLSAELEKLVPAATPKRDQLLAKLKADALAEMAEKAAGQRIQDLVKSLEKRTGISVAGGFQRISENTVLMGYEFDRTAGIAAFGRTFAGNLREAVEIPGITVTRGSFVRDSLTRRTSIGLTLFGGEAVRIDQFIKACEISFEGDGIFRLRFTGGRKTESKVFGRNKMVETLFTATTRAMGEGVIRDNDIRLRITLYQKNAADAAKRSASVLAMIVPDGGEAARRMKAAITRNPKGAYKTVCSIAPSAFGKLTFTSFETPARPKELPHMNDQANYKTFMEVFRKLYPDQSDFLPAAADQYNEWTRVAGALDGGSLTEQPQRPNRRSWPQGPVLPNDPWPKAGGLAKVNKDTRFAVAIVLEAARNFMNTCEDLATLASSLDDARTENAFQHYVQDMFTLAKKVPGSFPIQFTQPTLAALCERMGGEVVNLDLPEDDEPRPEFAVRIDLQ